MEGEQRRIEHLGDHVRYLLPASGLRGERGLYYVWSGQCRVRRSGRGSECLSARAGEGTWMRHGRHVIGVPVLRDVGVVGCQSYLGTDGSSWVTQWSKMAVAKEYAYTVSWMVRVGEGYAGLPG